MPTLWHYLFTLTFLLAADHKFGVVWKCLSNPFLLLKFRCLIKIIIVFCYANNRLAAQFLVFIAQRWTQFSSFSLPDQNYIIVRKQVTGLHVYVPLEVLYLSLCGNGVALSLKPRYDASISVAYVKHKHVKKSSPSWNSNSQPQDPESEALPVEPLWLIISGLVWSVCGQCAKCNQAI